jgi:hypothetical protein
MFSVKERRDVDPSQFVDSFRHRPPLITMPRHEVNLRGSSGLGNRPKSVNPMKTWLALSFVAFIFAAGDWTAHAQNPQTPQPLNLEKIQSDLCT